MAPVGSSITLTASANALSANDSTVINAQVVEAAGTPPHSGTHITFTTTLGRMVPAEVETDSSGRASARFMAGGSNGTATINAVSGGVTTGIAGAIKIAVGSAAVGHINLSANPTVLPTSGGSSTITASVLDVNGNSLVGASVSFTTSAGTISTGVATTNASGLATTVLTTNQTAKVTASVGTGTITSGSGDNTTTSGVAPATVDVTVQGAPTLSITPPPGGVTKGISAQFTVIATPATSASGPSGAPVRDVSINWGDGTSPQSLGALTTSSTGQTVSHTFPRSENYLVSITMTDVTGSVTTVSTPVSVGDPPASTVVLTPSSTTAAHGSAISFDVSITPPASGGVTIASATLNYGDGTAPVALGGGSTSRLHIFSTAGIYTVTLTVTDSSGQTFTRTVDVQIT